MHIYQLGVQFDFLVHRYERAVYDDEIEALGGRIYRLPRLIPWSVSYNKALNRFFEEHREYRIVHVHQDCLSSVILRAAKRQGVPVRIAHSHTANQDRNIKYLIKLFYKRFIPGYATELFACGQQAGDWMFGGAPYNIVNNAIDTISYCFSDETRKRIRKRLGISDNVMVVGHVGRFSPPKNHEFLVDIFAQILKIVPDARLLLVGDGELRSDIEKKIRELGIASNVIFTGVRSDVPNLMQAMDVFLFPSLYEGFGVVLAEAQASGLPCVISDQIPADCDLTDLISRYSLERDAKDWAQAVCDRRNFRRKDTADEIAAAGFDIRKNAQWLQKHYLSL